MHPGHIKDLADGVVTPTAGIRDFPEIKHDYFEDVGHGQFDYRPCVVVASKAGMRYFFVELRDIPYETYHRISWPTRLLGCRSEERRVGKEC